MIGVFNQQVPAFFRILDTAIANGSRPDMKLLFSRLSMNVIGLSAFNCEVPRHSWDCVLYTRARITF